MEGAFLPPPYSCTNGQTDQNKLHFSIFCWNILKTDIRIHINGEQSTINRSSCMRIKMWGTWPTGTKSGRLPWGQSFIAAASCSLKQTNKHPLGGNAIPYEAFQERACTKIGSCMQKGRFHHQMSLQNVWCWICDKQISRWEQMFMAFPFLCKSPPPPPSLLWMCSEKAVGLKALLSDWSEWNKQEVEIGCAAGCTITLFLFFTIFLCHLHFLQWACSLTTTLRGGFG